MFWIGYLISALAASSSAKKEEQATIEENVKAEEQARWANEIKLKQYEREQRLTEAKFAYDQKKDRIHQFEQLINSSEATKSRMSQIWPRGGSSRRMTLAD